MLIAYKNGNYIHASPDTDAECPHCHQKVISKCGSIKIWHWAHLSEYICPFSSEPETEWHLKWKYLSLKYGGVLEKRFGEHIADSVIKNTVFEFQHSSISTEEIIKRCEYYKKKGYHVIWVFDYSEKFLNKHIIVNLQKHNPYASFNQKIISIKHNRKYMSILFDGSKNPIYGKVYLDSGISVYDICHEVYNNKEYSYRYVCRSDVFWTFPIDVEKLKRLYPIISRQIDIKPKYIVTSESDVLKKTWIHGCIPKETGDNFVPKIIIPKIHTKDFIESTYISDTITIRFNTSEFCYELSDNDFQEINNYLEFCEVYKKISRFRIGNSVGVILMDSTYFVEVYDTIMNMILNDINKL